MLKIKIFDELVDMIKEEGDITTALIIEHEEPYLTTINKHIGFIFKKIIPVFEDKDLCNSFLTNILKKYNKEYCKGMAIQAVDHIDRDVVWFLALHTESVGD